MAGTFRPLVQCPAEPTAPASSSALTDQVVGPVVAKAGFNWWIILIIVGGAAVLYYLDEDPKKRKTRRRRRST